MSQISQQSVLAKAFLARIPPAEHKIAVRELAACVNNDTLGLVASLVECCPDEDASSRLRLYLISAIEQGQVALAVDTCDGHLDIQEALLDLAEGELQKSLNLLASRPRNSGTLVPRERLLKEQVSASNEVEQKDHLDYDVKNLAVRTIQYLDFVKQVVRRSSSQASFHCSYSLLFAILDLLFASSINVSAAARDAVFALLATRDVGFILPNDTKSMHQDLWLSIDMLLEHGTHSSYRTTAYGLWLRWLELSNVESEQQKPFMSDRYWKHIIKALAAGDTEQRKTCLHILRRSLAIARSDISTPDMHLTQTRDSSSTIAQYGRYCTVYETIVIGRYLNQAEECISDLDVLASSHTQVEKSWLFALLEPALSSVTQDSIRKMLGNWLMSTDMAQLHHSTEFAKLLKISFLPWAMQGHLFTSTLRGNLRDMQCQHGKRLAGFLQRLLHAHSSGEATPVRRAILRSVLDYLQQYKSRVVAHGVIHVLHGLVSGLESETIPCMTVNDVNDVLDLSATNGFPEVARDALWLQCWKLVQTVQKQPQADHTPTQETTPESRSGKYNILADRIAELQSRQNEQGKRRLQWQSIKDFLGELETTRSACLQGEGLLLACQSLTDVLNSQDAPESRPEELHAAIDAIWTEIEVQDYPKNALLLMPSLILHSKCVMHSLDDEDLADLLISLVSELHGFTKSRIYLWSPLMRRLRAAILQYPALGAKLDAGDLIVRTANDPPSPKIEFQLEASIVRLLEPRTYEDYYGDFQESGYAAFFDIVNRLGQIDSAIVWSTYQTMLEPWINQKSPVPVVSKWKTTIQLQILLILLEQGLAANADSFAAEQMDALCAVISTEPLPRFRYLLEWMIARIVLGRPETGSQILDRLSTMDHHSNPKYLASLTKIAVMIACTKGCSEAFADRVMCRLVALSSSSKIIIRHEAQWSFPILWEHAVHQGWDSITSNPASASLNEYIRSLERFTVPPAARELERLNPDTDHTLANLFQGGYLQLEPPGEEVVTVADMQALYEQDKANRHLPKPLLTGCLPLGTYSTSTVITKDATPPQQPLQEEPKQSARNEAFAALQTKGTAYLSTSTSSSVESPSCSTDLIVVGSLVDNAYNLGGLSRISEIFGASALYISSPRSVLANKDFVSVAVSSQNHLPIYDLAVENMQAFLSQKKTQGYSVVGVEQTDRSVMLGDEATKLPAKTLLVMGAEKEGIPALILGECDILVEVPQRGVTRSMNVQTAAGVVLYEYSRQHRSNQSA